MVRPHFRMWLRFRARRRQRICLFITKPSAEYGPLAVSVTQGNRPQDRGELLGDMEQPSRNLTWHFKEGHCRAGGRHAREIHGLDCAARVHGEVFHPVRVPEEAVPPQNIMLSCHGLMGRELEGPFNAGQFILSLRNFGV